MSDLPLVVKNVSQSTTFWLLFYWIPQWQMSKYKTAQITLDTVRRGKYRLLCRTDVALGLVGDFGETAFNVLVIMAKNYISHNLIEKVNGVI